MPLAGAVVTVVAACAISLAGGFALKAQCLKPWVGYHQYSSLCYNDIQPLWGPRGIADRALPYINGELHAGELVGGAIEYPVLTGVFMWVGGAWAETFNDYLVHTAILLAPFGLLAAYMLARISGWRALLFAAAPALVLYSFHNWDLLVVAAVAAGFYAWYRGHSVIAAALFGVGAALKMYPLLFIAPLVLERVWARRWGGAAAIAGAGLGVVALVNLPFAVMGFDGWVATYEFHTLRGPNTDNIWALRDFGPIHLPALEPARLNLVTGAIAGALFAVALGAGWLKARKEDRYPVVAVSGALLAAFLLVNKVHSPQYTLWILVFFVLLRVHIGWWIAYTVADIAVYVGVFRFFFESCTTNGCRFFDDPTFWQEVMTAGVFFRAALLAALFAIFLRSPDAGMEHVVAAAPVPSHPPSKVVSVGER